jgi:hypothetical protein
LWTLSAQSGIRIPYSSVQISKLFLVIVNLIGGFRKVILKIENPQARFHIKYKFVNTIVKGYTVLGSNEIKRNYWAIVFREAMTARHFHRTLSSTV